jgi:DNA-binding NarL/FixJ family response regulator
VIRPSPVRVVLAEDSYLVREGVRRLLELRDEVELVAVCEDLDSLLAAVGETPADVVVTDIRMPPSHTDEGIRVAEHLRATSPETGVVVLSQYADPRFALRLLEHGSAGRGYLLKERVSDLDQLLAAIGEVARGGSVIDPKVVDQLVASRASAAQSRLDELTPRELETLSEMAQGKNNAAIAASLVLTERAVEKHINAIFSKLGLTWEPDVNRRVKAVLVYLAEQGAPRAGGAEGPLL